MLSEEFEAELRGMINPMYEDIHGTESYERKRLLGEIDRLREEAAKWRALAGSAVMVAESCQRRHEREARLDLFDEANE